MRLRLLPPSDTLDVAVVLLAVGACELQSWRFGDIPGPQLGQGLPLFLLLTLPLLWRRRRPLLACVLVMGGLCAFSIADVSPEGLEIIAPLTAVSYSVSAHSRRSVAYVGLAVLAAGYGIYALNDPNITSGRTSDLWAGAFFGVAILALWLLGVFLHGRAEARMLERRAVAFQHEALSAVSDERARMARELHDIVSHNLSVVVVQAAGARASGADNSALEKIERSGREALVEMRRLLGVLRDEEHSPDAMPQPGLAQLPELAANVRAAGLTVALTVTGGRESLPAAVQLSAFRIVQEALTNTLKHAGPAAIQVVVDCSADQVAIRVIDDGVGSHGNGSAPRGHGLIGMRERVALFGGELRAGPRGEGGFEVVARLPVGRESS
jgi:signal transduction histidine kinase